MCRFWGLLLILLCGEAAWAEGVTIPGSFRVNESGAAVYEIPVDVPPGINKIEPKLSISYNSQSGNGLMGYGWSMGGLSQITRCAQTMAQDRVRKGITHTSDDRFCLDGKRLMVMAGAKYGAAETEYRTEVETFQKIVAHGGSMENGPEWFEVWTKEGLVLQYGKSGHVLYSNASGKTNVSIVWMLNRVEDRKGNYQTFDYWKSDAEGWVVPWQIEYAGNGTSTPKVRVYFNTYEDRADSQRVWVAGSKSTLRKRLKSFSTLLVNAYDTVNDDRSVGATLVRKYSLEYTGGDVIQPDRLDKINVCNVSSCLEPKKIVYGSAAGDGVSLRNIFVPAVDTTTPEERLIEIQNALKCSVLGMQTSGDQSIGPGIKCYSTNASNYWHEGDFNGDGKGDFVHIRRNSTDGRVVSWLSNGSGSFSEVLFQSNVDVHPLSSHWFTGDVNADGLTDLIHLSGVDGKVYSWMAKGDGEYDVVDSGLNVAKCSYEDNTCGQWQVGDFDGDGRSDLIFMPYANDSYVNVWFSLGSGKFNVVAFDSGVDRGLLSSSMYDDLSWTVLDLNGDGKSDLVHLNLDKKAHFAWLSSGQGFDIKEIKYFNLNGDILPKEYVDVFGGVILLGMLGPKYTFVGDFNGDGLAEFYGMESMGDGNFIRYGNDQLQLTWKDIYDDSIKGDTTVFRPRVIVGDVNGDGKDDVLIIPGSEKAILGVNSDHYLVGLSQGGRFGFASYEDEESTQLYTRGLFRLNNIFGGEKSGLVVVELSQVRSLEFGYGFSNKVQEIYTESDPGKGDEISLNYASLVGVDYPAISTGAKKFNTVSAGATLSLNSAAVAAYPLVARANPSMSVVASSSQKGVGNFSYEYSGLLSSYDGRGMLGFSTVRHVNSINGVSVVYRYNQNWPFVGTVRQEVKSNSQGSVLSRTTNQYLSVDMPNGISKYSSLVETVRELYDPAVSQSVPYWYNRMQRQTDCHAFSPYYIDGLSVPISNDGSCYGNVLVERVNAMDGHEHIVSKKYKNDPLTWLVGLPIRMEMTHTTNAAPLTLNFSSSSGAASGASLVSETEVVSTPLSAVLRK